MKVTILAIIVTLLGCNGRQQIISGLEGTPLPPFNVLLTDSTTLINSEKFDLGKPIVLFYFSPFCPYCKAQTEEIKQDIKSLSNIQFYFLSPFPVNQIKDYDEKYGLSANKNIIVAQIRDSSFTKFYHIPGVPYMAVYNDQKKLTEVLLGKVSIDDIKDIAFKK